MLPLMPQFRSLRYAVPLLAAVVLLGGCSGSPSDDRAGGAKVATLQSSAPRTSPSAARDDERPLVPLDASDADREALTAVWAACVSKEGGPAYRNPKAVFTEERSPDPKKKAKAKAVQAACLAKYPETYEERVKRTDIAAFRDAQRRWYQCAGRAGYKLTEPDENGEFGITEVGPNGDFASPKMEACRKAAFQ
jgi:hypothetical protein